MFYTGFDFLTCIISGYFEICPFVLPKIIVFVQFARSEWPAKWIFRSRISHETRFLAEISKATCTILLKIIFILPLFVFYTRLKFLARSISGYFRISPFVMPKTTVFLFHQMNFHLKIGSQNVVRRCNHPFHP